MGDLSPKLPFPICVCASPGRSGRRPPLSPRRFVGGAWKDGGIYRLCVWLLGPPSYLRATFQSNKETSHLLRGNDCTAQISMRERRNHHLIWYASEARRLITSSPLPPCRPGKKQPHTVPGGPGALGLAASDSTYLPVPYQVLLVVGRDAWGAQGHIAPTVRNAEPAGGQRLPG